MIGSQFTHPAPASGLLKYWFGRLWYWIAGWDVTGEIPDHKKFVLIGAYHTSNWDFPFGICALYIFRLKASWMGKDALFKWPLGIVMRALGGIAIDRSSPHGVVVQTANQLKNSDTRVIMLAAEGTRSKREYWKSGFYWIAYEAQVPIVCGYLDYEKKQACIGLSLMPTGNVKQDMDKIRKFYKNVHGKKPHKQTPIRLRKEE